MKILPVFPILVALLGALAISPCVSPDAWAAGTVDASCRGVRTEVLPVLAYPRKGELVAEQKEITLQLLSLIPCSAPARTGKAEIEAIMRGGVAKGSGVQNVAAELLAHFRKGTSDAKPGSGEVRQVFALVSEFYDNLSLTLFEFAPGREPVSIQLTMKRDAWTDALEALRPRFQDTASSLLATWAPTSSNRSVRIVFNDASPSQDATLARLRAELSASLASRYRNPLPPKLWERRAFFRLAGDDETADTTLEVNVELKGTRVFARVLAKQNDGNARSLWLEGSLASLIGFENRLFEESRDMLMEVVGIYDYTVTFGPEFLLDGSHPSFVPSLSMRHNRGDLAATLRVRAGRMHWQGTCGDRPTLVDFGLLPGWQFFQTERLSMDMGAELAAGIIDIAFEQDDGCVGTHLTQTFVSAGYGLFAQANYTTTGRLSVLGRVAAGGLSIIPTGDKGDDTVRSTRNVSLFLGAGLAL